MKKHFNLIITKFLLVAPILGFIGPIFSNMDLKISILTAGIITLGTYLSADLVLLRQYGTKIALAGDAVISIAIFWEMSSIIDGAIVNFPGIFLAAALIVFGEWYYHPYLMRILPKPQATAAKNISVTKKTQSRNQKNKPSKNNSKKKK